MPEDVWRRRLANPETDLEGPLAVARDVLLAFELQRAHKPRGARELIERKQSQRVAHDDAHAGGRATLLAGMAQPAQHHRKRCKPEVSLGLATACREEQQVHRCAVGVARVGKAREIQQQEGELECTPSRGLDAETLAERPGHRAIRHAERVERIRILSQHRDAPLDPVGGNTREAHEFIRCVAATSLQRRDGRSPRLDPGAILTYERPKRCLDGSAIGERAECLHRQLDARHVHGRRLFDLGAWNPRTADQPTRAVHNFPFGRDTMASGVFGGVSVVKIGDLIVPLGGLRAAQVRPRNKGMIRRAPRSRPGRGRRVGLLFVRFAMVYEKDRN